MTDLTSRPTRAARTLPGEPGPHPLSTGRPAPGASGAAQEAVALFVLDRSTEDVDSLLASALPGREPAGVRDLAHARARQDVATTWLRLAHARTAAIGRLDELGRVLCLLAGAHRDHPDFPALARRWPSVGSDHPLW